MTTRQRAYQLRNVAIGKCQCCPEPGVKGYCAKHRGSHNTRRTTDAAKKRRREAYALTKLWRKPWLVFGLRKPYTAEQVRKALRQYVARFGLHPDRGGDEKTMQRFNRLAQKAIEAITWA